MTMPSQAALFGPPMFSSRKLDGVEWNVYGIAWKRTPESNDPQKDYFRVGAPLHVDYKAWNFVPGHRRR
jgi:hypothetical protein